MENKEKIYPRTIERHKESRDLMTAKIAKGRGYTREDEFECLRCGSPIKLRSLAEKSQKVHFQGECYCNREINDPEARRKGWKKQDAIPEEGQVELEKSKVEKFNFTVTESKSFQDLGYDVISNGKNEVVIIQNSCILNPALLGVHLVNEITPKGFVFVWSSREERRIKELDNLNSELIAKLEKYKKNYSIEEKLKKENDELSSKYNILKEIENVNIEKYKKKLSKVKSALEKERDDNLVLRKSLDQFRGKINQINTYESTIKSLENEISKLNGIINTNIKKGNWKEIFQKEIGSISSKHIKEKESLNSKLKGSLKEIKNRDEIIEEKDKKIQELRKKNMSLIS